MAKKQAVTLQERLARLNEPTNLIKALDTANTDIYVYSGGLYEPYITQVLDSVVKRDRKENVSLFLTTYGGNPHSAYRLASVLKAVYRQFRLVVWGSCKSAGTLVAVGADELAFGLSGELGPLDVQLAKPDELIPQSSGLDTLQAVASLRGAAFDAFQDYMGSIISDSRGAISTKTACEVAVQLVDSIFGPIAAQIDPHRLGEVDRMMCAGSAGTGERALRVSVRCRPAGGDFQGIGVFRSDGVLGRARKLTSAPVIIVSMSPPGYPSAGLLPSRARFRFTRQRHCNSKTQTAWRRRS